MEEKHLTPAADEPVVPAAEEQEEPINETPGPAAAEEPAAAPAEAGEEAPEAEAEEDDNAQWEAYEREQAEIEESRRKPGKYRWVLKPEDMREAMLDLEKAKGRTRMYNIAAYAMCIFALFPTANFIVTRDLFSSRAGRGAVKQMNPRGIKFSAEAKKHGLQLSDTVNKGSLMPYSFFKVAYETENYLSLVTVKNSALHIKRDDGSASYRALRDRLQQELGEHFEQKQIQKKKK